MNEEARATGQFRIDEILGQKVNPVEKQVFETRKSRMRLILGVVVWVVAISLFLFATSSLLALLDVLL